MVAVVAPAAVCTVAASVVSVCALFSPACRMYAGFWGRGRGVSGTRTRCPVGVMLAVSFRRSGYGLGGMLDIVVVVEGSRNVVVTVRIEGKRRGMAGDTHFWSR